MTVEMKALMIRSSRPKVFCKKGVFRNFAKFTGKHLCLTIEVWFIVTGSARNLIACKENCNLRQYMLAKPNKWGFNVVLNLTKTFSNHKNHKTFAINFLQAFH